MKIDLEKYLFVFKEKSVDEIWRFAREYLPVCLTLSHTHTHTQALIDLILIIINTTTFAWIYNTFDKKIKNEK